MYVRVSVRIYMFARVRACVCVDVCLSVRVPCDVTKQRHAWQVTGQVTAIAQCRRSETGFNLDGGEFL